MDIVLVLTGSIIVLKALSWKFLTWTSICVHFWIIYIAITDWLYRFPDTIVFYVCSALLSLTLVSMHKYNLFFRWTKPPTWCECGCRWLDPGGLVGWTILPRRRRAVLCCLHYQYRYWSSNRGQCQHNQICPPWANWRDLKELCRIQIHYLLKE